MKKKIIIGITVFSLVFLLAGVYIIITIESSTSKLNKLILLHQVEILREHLLIQIKRVQSDLNLKNTRHARSMDASIVNVKNMVHVADACFGCHHSEDVWKRLNNLREEVKHYRDSLSRVSTIRANVKRLEAEEDTAFEIGENLIQTVNKMIALTTLKLNEKTAAALNNIARTKIILYILVAMGPLSITGLGFMLIRGFTKPVSKLMEETARLKGGDLDYRIDGLKDEFGKVAESFNAMANSLKDQMIKMQRTEQMAVLGELAAGFAHEIKNPLAGIKASMEVLAEEQNIPIEDRTVMLKVTEEIKRIELLIKSLLNFAKPPKPHLAVVNINEIINKTINFSVRHPSLSSNTTTTINVVKDFDISLPYVTADPMQLQQAFMNLLLNAIDAMPDGGILTVKTSYDTALNSAKIEISDTGKGMDKEVRDKIFQPFFTTKSKGTGLGLAITKQLIVQHGGDIHAESSIGKGTSFKIILPIKQEGKEHIA